MQNRIVQPTTIIGVVGDNRHGKTLRETQNEMFLRVKPKEIFSAGQRMKAERRCVRIPVSDLIRPIQHHTHHSDVATRPSLHKGFHPRTLFNGFENGKTFHSIDFEDEDDEDRCNSKPEDSPQFSSSSNFGLNSRTQSLNHLIESLNIDDNSEATSLQHSDSDSLDEYEVPQEHDSECRMPPKAPKKVSSQGSMHRNSFPASSISPKKIKKSIPDPKRSVSFDQVHVRVFERNLSDNPAVNAGPAIGIGWNIEDQYSLDVDDWERRRGPYRRQEDRLVLSSLQREMLLHAAGYSDRQIAAAVRDINKAKRMRERTVEKLGVHKVEEDTTTTLKHKVKKFLFQTRHKKSHSN